MTPNTPMTELPVELLPCPFCGEMPEVRGSVIGCKNIKCWGPSIWRMVNPEDSAAAWNRRHLSATVPAGDGELVERLMTHRKQILASRDGFKEVTPLSADLLEAASRLSQGTGDSEPGWVEIIEQSLTPDGGVALTLQLDGEETTVVAHFGGSNG